MRWELLRERAIDACMWTRPALIGLGMVLQIGAAFASPSATGAPLVPTLDAIDRAAAADRQARCGSSECRATEALSRSLGVLLDAQATTNGVTRPVPADRDRLAASALDPALLDRPALYAPVCRLARDLASRYGAPGAPGELFVAVGLLQLAGAIDDRGQAQCLTRLLAAFPRNDAADTAIANARTLCENRPGGGGNCARLAR